MISVKFLGPLGLDDMEFDVKNLSELKAKLAERSDLNLGEWLKICAVAVNDEIVTELDTELKNGDRVALLPPVCGG